VIRAWWTSIQRAFGRSRDLQNKAAGAACAPADAGALSDSSSSSAPPTSAPELAVEEPVSSPASGPDESAVDFATHLEFLGYSIEAAVEGWRHARHPVRYNFSFRATEVGLRMHCGITIGSSLPGGRRAWLEFINTANDQAVVACFALIADDEGVQKLQVRHLFSGPYSRAGFGAAMDMWHEDLALIRYAPPPDQPADESADDQVPTTVVH
jgi:hypothetical protein